MAPYAVLLLTLALVNSTKSTCKATSTNGTAKVEYHQYNGSGFYLNGEGELKHGVVPCTDLNKTGCEFVITHPASRCYCHRGRMWCDGFIADADVKQKPVHVGHEICVVVTGQACADYTKPDELNCHQEKGYFHGPKEMEWSVIVTVLVMLTLVCTWILLRMCTAGIVILKPKPWCRWNCWLLLVIMLMNKYKGVSASLAPGECKNGVCLRGCYDKGDCRLVGFSFPNPEFDWKAEAWCWHHECCMEATQKLDIFKCHMGDYGWAAGCGVARKGCWYCGVKVNGPKHPIYQCIMKRRECMLTSKGKVYKQPITTQSQYSAFFSPNDGCKSNPPHVGNNHTWRHTGEFSCNCPDPWHCANVGEIGLDGICVQDGQFLYRGGQGVYAVSEPVDIEHNIKPCNTSGNCSYPCWDGDEVCWDKGCKLKNPWGHSTYTETFYQRASEFDLGGGWNPFGIFTHLPVVLMTLLIVVIVLKLL